MKPLAVDLCCGLGGWSEGLMAEGWDVVGFDVERHKYGEHQYPAQLVLQDIRTLTGGQFKGRVSLIVASPPCQKYSYMAMPWTKAKALQTWYRDPQHPERIVALNELFDACFRIAKEAHCPIIVENVRGAQPWVGRCRWMFGSFALWGDVPALMPMTMQRRMKSRVSCVPRMFSDRFASTPEEAHALHYRLPRDDIKNTGGSWFNIAHNTTSGKGRNPDGRKVPDPAEHHDAGNKGNWMKKPDANGKRELSGQRATWSGTTARKAASAMIAKIPEPLARWIARAYYPGA